MAHVISVDTSSERGTSNISLFSGKSSVKLCMKYSLSNHAMVVPAINVKPDKQSGPPRARGLKAMIEPLSPISMQSFFD